MQAAGISGFESLLLRVSNGTVTVPVSLRPGPALR